VIRVEEDLSVKRITGLLGVPRATWYRHRAKSLAGEPVKGPWPAPLTDQIEPLAAKVAQEYPAWGHRKVWAMLRYDDVHASPRTVARAMARRGLLLPLRYQAERRQLAAARRAVFVEAPTRRKGMAARLLRVRNHRRWDLASRRCRRLRRESQPRVPSQRDQPSG
jgi:putative transposase